MNERTDAESRLRALAEERVPLEDATVAVERRERLLPALASAIREVPARRERGERIRRWTFVFAAAAAIALVGGYAQQQLLSRGTEAKTLPAAEPSIASLGSVSGTVVVTHGGSGRVLGDADRSMLTAGDEIETAGDGAALVQTERRAIHVRAATHVSLLPLSVAEERIRLALGHIDLKVKKQPNSPRSVVVETPNAEVVVRGTEFTVKVGSENSTPVTRVQVTEGSVWVLHAGARELVSVGEEWASNREKPAGDSLAPLAPTPSVAALEPAPARRAVAARARAQAGTLTEENGLYTAALEARNRGDDKRALELFNTLLTRYPSSQLTELAQVERMRAFKRLGDRGAAAAEARRYLAEHPSGSIRDEARGVVLGEQ